MGLLIPEGDTLVTYYLLPLVGANKKTFGRHFKTSYIDRLGLKVYVELKSNMKVPSYKTNPNYISELVHQNVLFILFAIPTKYIDDAFLFLNGRYSEISKEAKNIIYNTSTLPFNKTMGSFTNSHPILQALDKTKTLRSFLVTELHINTLPETVELIDAPYNSWFIESRF